jgi:2',3'-cyclic-nucleotide 2'-phosphodiesterase (5'-nucleotidase family)
MTHQDVADDRHTIASTNCDLLLGGHDHEVYVEQVSLIADTFFTLKVPNTASKDTWLVKVGKNATLCGVIGIEVNTEGVGSRFCPCVNCYFAESSQRGSRKISNR